MKKKGEAKLNKGTYIKGEEGGKHDDGNEDEEGEEEGEERQNKDQKTRNLIVKTNVHKIR